MPEMQEPAEAGAVAPLLDVQSLRVEDGPPLSVGGQLRGVR